MSHDFNRRGVLGRGSAAAVVPDLEKIAHELDCVIVSVDYRLAPDTHAAVPYGAVPARVSDLSRLPPTFIGTGAVDLTREFRAAQLGALRRAFS